MIKSMPPEDNLDMPVQNFKLKRSVLKTNLTVSTGTKAARFMLVTITTAFTTAGTVPMVWFLHPYLNHIQYILFLILFVLNFTWISFAAASAAEGFFRSRKSCRWPEKPVGTSKTALLMPLYNENAARSMATMEAMARELHQKNVSDNFEIVLLSDSTDTQVIPEEMDLYEELQLQTKMLLPIWYRHREKNTARKAGNIGDFVRRWGHRYTYMIVLDADSVMSTDTILTMVERMQGDDSIGILQTVPALYGRTNLFARLQQFASRIYGGINAAGIACWTGNEGNYWGHNAIIRVSAFAESCGLPILSGRKPFGGYILSHDFVEAALMRRSGWKVRIATDMQGSWEESPPSLLDQITRDRRWMQGNMQHLKVMTMKGLPFCNRVHFAVGILGYVSSILWLLLIVTGFGIILPLLQLYDSPDQIFSAIYGATDNSGSIGMIKLFVYTMIILFLPKILGYVHTVFTPALCRKSGGFIAVTIGVVLEILFSILFAPIQMITNTKSMAEILTGKDSGWKKQRRSVDKITFAEAWHFHRSHFLIGFGSALLLLFFLPGYFLCFLPIISGLLLSVPLSVASASTSVGLLFKKCRLFLIPEETTSYSVITSRDSLEQTLMPYTIRAI